MDLHGKQVDGPETKISMPIASSKQVQQARKAIVGLLELLELSCSDPLALGLIVSELAANVFLHGGGGQFRCIINAERLPLLRLCFSQTAELRFASHAAVTDEHGKGLLLVEAYLDELGAGFVRDACARVIEVVVPLATRHAA